MNFDDLKIRLIKLEHDLAHFQINKPIRHADLVGKAAKRPLPPDKHAIRWKDVKPPNDAVDSWATRIGALAVTSALLTLEDELQGSARSIVTLMALTILVLSYGPLWRYSLRLYQQQKKSRTMRDSYRLIIPFALTTVMALGALPIFSLSTQDFLNYLMSTDGRYTIVSVFLVWVGVFFCVGEYRRLIRPASDKNDKG